MQKTTAVKKKPANKAPAEAKQSSAPTTPPGSKPVNPPPGSRPGSPAPSGRPASPVADEGGCEKKTTCDTCIAVQGGDEKPVCVFTEASKCVGLSTTPDGKLFRTTADCRSLKAQTIAAAAAEADLVKAAKSEFAKMKPHVFGTEKDLKNTSGRHLASALLSIPVNKNLKRAENAATGLSKFTNPPRRKIKTTWDDDKGKFTQAQVQAMCEDAIKSVLKLKNAKKLPKGTAITSVSVKSPLGGNLCISVQGNISVFPGSTSATTIAPGDTCTPDAGVSDN
ncbi:hypothetical protein E1B28_010417 [Marasmius oreades]|uniref:Uncharacterized protein n=1 Tax=Marasmius oreades TaxID=181124 RepID=A0A9P7RYJ8_9AGAR|nr:uncharacterized protein E1B28_010417 [Marasmius oreades]KAG7091378.1 hypothetical protein E1B28_010417 [Marasmius oreades]